jgi:hypothetical protein
MIAILDGQIANYMITVLDGQKQTIWSPF